MPKRKKSERTIRLLRGPKDDCAGVFCVRAGDKSSFYAFREVAWGVPIFWPALALLYFPGIPWFGVRVYRWVAANRLNIPLRNVDKCSL